LHSSQAAAASAGHRMAVYLASDESVITTGQILSVDGGALIV